MSAVCSICTNKINNTRKNVKCNGKMCQRSCHQECMGSDKTVDTWRCEDCTEPSLIDLMREIKKLGNMNKDLADSLNSCHGKIDELNELIKNQDLKIADCVSKVEDLSVKYALLEKENNELKVNLNNQEQYTRLNCIEIYGIPEVKEENILSTVGHVYNALNVKFDINNIDCCYRMNRQQKTTEPRGIFLSFLSRLKKEEFMNAKKTRRTLCLSDINIEWARNVQGGKQPVYINESLTSSNRALFSKCREFKKKQNIKFLWVKNGKILMRKSESAKVYVINSANGLNDVH